MSERLAFLPSRRAIVLLVGAACTALGLRLAGLPARIVLMLAAGFMLVLGAIVLADALATRSRWRAAPLRLTRRMSAAFAIGVPARIALQLENPGEHAWPLEIFDRPQAALLPRDQPRLLDVPARQRVELEYNVLPLRRGLAQFEPADLRARSAFGLLDARVRIGPTEARRVYPNFAAVARYAWLAADQRLSEIGVRTARRRGEGTEFRQLGEYRPGDPVRHIDWKATLRRDQPVVREFEDSRDQRVMLLLDCGRRMRADDSTTAVGETHFDEVLNAAMLLAHVALREGDAVGAMTFGTPPGAERILPPRKGSTTLTALMNVFGDVEPTPTHSDFLEAAQRLMLRQRKRALVVVLTNFRDEDVSELGAALALLRTRHLVLLASIRETIVATLANQPLRDADAAVQIAGARMYEQSRRDALARIAPRDALVLDVEPRRLGVELVNRYRAAKRAGSI